MENDYAIRFSDIIKKTWIFHIDGKSYEIPAGSVKLYDIDGQKRARCNDVTARYTLIIGDQALKNSSEWTEKDQKRLEHEFKLAEANRKD